VFHTRQAAEKRLKALIAMADIEPPLVHGLAELTDLAGKAKSGVRTLAAAKAASGAARRVFAQYGAQKLEPQSNLRYTLIIL
jgi:HEPN domain-containing protein